MKIYISGSLKVVSDRKKIYEFYKFLASVCTDCGFDAYLPHTKSDPKVHAQLSCKKIFQMDLEQIQNSDKILAVIDVPSTGMGAEIRIALEYGKEIIAVCQKEQEPSRFILGLLEYYNSKIINYSDLDDCRKQLIEHFQKKSSTKIC